VNSEGKNLITLRKKELRSKYGVHHTSVDLCLIVHIDGMTGEIKK
jgi:hypothetical protein